MKTKIYLLLLITLQCSISGTAQTAGKISVKFDGIYECKEWKYIDDKVQNPEPAYYRFYPDGVLLFCHYDNPKTIKRDSMATAQDVFNTVLNQSMLNKIKDDMLDDPANVYKVYNNFKVTAYKYQILPNGICYDILSERPNCLGKPNLKVPDSTILKADDGVPADDRYFKFVQVQ